MLSIRTILNFPYLVKSQSLYQVCPLITVDPCDQPTESWNRMVLGHMENLPQAKNFACTDCAGRQGSIL